ncbi:hypothetical protein ES703_21524 [subsurface metagenome]
MTSLKCDYEKAWKEIEEKFGDEIVHCEDNKVGNTAGKLKSYMKEIEGRHRNIIDIRRRSKEEVTGLFMRKFMDLFAKYLVLKNRLGKLNLEIKGGKTKNPYFEHELNQIYRSVEKDIEECKIGKEVNDD